MKKGFAIFFLSIYLVSITQFTQFLKVPLLVSHYIEHKKESPKMSLLDFLGLHYKHQDHANKKDTNQDHNLPFLNLNNVLNVVCLSPHSIYFEPNTKVLIINSQKQTLLNESYKEFAFLKAIWQPPRIS